MFIRRKPNKSGSTSVQVVVKTRERRQRVVKSLGFGHSEHELLELERQGRDYIVHAAQELTRNMYALNCMLPKSRKRKRIILGMSSKQQELFDLVSPSTEDSGKA